MSGWIPTYFPNNNTSLPAYTQVINEIRHPMTEPFVPWYAPYGMTDEEYEHERQAAIKRHFDWTEDQMVQQAIEVVSLELAKKLKELGVKQESLLSWHMTVSLVIADQTYKENGYSIQQREALDDMYPNGVTYPAFSAFTAAELLNVLPASTCLVKKTNIKNKSELRYYAETFEHHPAVTTNLYDDNPANALAKLYIELYECN